MGWWIFLIGLGLSIVIYIFLIGNIEYHQVRSPSKTLAILVVGLIVIAIIALSYSLF